MDKHGNPENHTVTITVDSDGNFTYENPLIWVDRGDTIVWECTNKCPFAVYFGWDSPLKKGRFNAAKGNKISTVVPENAPPGHYNYTSAVFLDGEIWMDDTEVIIRRPRR